MTNIVNLAEQRGLVNASHTSDTTDTKTKDCRSCRFWRLPDPKVQEAIDRENASVDAVLAKQLRDEAALDRARVFAGKEPALNICHVAVDTQPELIEAVENFRKSGPSWTEFMSIRRYAPDTRAKDHVNCNAWRPKQA